jgi:hypothetical protein
LEQIERDLDPVFDASPFNELKQIILRRIAELELSESLQTAPVTAILSAVPVRNENPVDPSRPPLEFRRRTTPVSDLTHQSTA